MSNVYDGGDGWCCGVVLWCVVGVVGTVTVSKSDTVKRPLSQGEGIAHVSRVSPLSITVTYLSKTQPFFKIISRFFVHHQKNVSLIIFSPTILNLAETSLATTTCATA